MRLQTCSVCRLRTGRRVHELDDPPAETYSCDRTAACGIAIFSGQRARAGGACLRVASAAAAELDGFHAPRRPGRRAPAGQQVGGMLVLAQALSMPSRSSSTTGQLLPAQRNGIVELELVV